MERSRLDYSVCSIQEPARKTTRYFSILVKVSSLLLLLDRYLLSNFKGRKQQISHLLHDNTFSDHVTIEEETAYEGEIGTILSRYLKSGKELVK